MKCPDCGNIMKCIYKDFFNNDYICEQCGYNTNTLEMKKLVKDETELYKLRNNRKKLIKTLLEELEYKVITKNEIVDMMIDLEIYNKKCKERRNIK